MRFPTAAAAIGCSLIAFACGVPGGEPAPRVGVAATAPDPATDAGGPGETTDGGVMRGRFTYMADAAIFEDCATGRAHPVAMEGGYLDAERAYLADRPEPGAPLLVTFDGRIEPRPPMEGHGLIDTIVIDRFGATHPGEDCDGE